jgi:hypothetical protein
MNDPNADSPGVACMLGDWGSWSRGAIRLGEVGLRSTNGIKNKAIW